MRAEYFTPITTRHCRGRVLVDRWITFVCVFYFYNSTPAQHARGRSKADDDGEWGRGGAYVLNEYRSDRFDRACIVY